LEKRIKNIFDFQRFSPDERLSAMITKVQNRYMQLSDEDLEMVAAAGDPFQKQESAENAWEVFGGSE
jgi:uncharacterized phage-associated protein